MVERASMALTQIRSELQKTGTSVRLQLSLQSDSGPQRVHVLLHCDNYSDVLAATAQVLSCHDFLPCACQLHHVYLCAHVQITGRHHSLGGIIHWCYRPTLS